MEPRFDYKKIAPGVYQSMLGLEQYLHQCGLEKPLLLLVQLRCSQINGCAYCLDMHWKDLRAIGQEEQKLYELDAWEESSFYSERERAALGWAESITKINEGHACDEVYKKVKKQFTDKELSDLTFQIVVINAWNRLNIAARTVPGSYQP